MSPLEILITINVSVDYDTIIFTELDQMLENLYYKIAHKYPVQGMDFDDVVQELRIKAWDVVKRDKYNPDNKAKPSSFFHTVLTNHALNLQRSTRTKKSQDEFMNRSVWSIDLESEHDDSGTWLEQRIELSSPFDHYFCDRCSRIVDEHSKYSVIGSEIYCEACTIE